MVIVWSFPLSWVVAWYWLLFKIGLVCKFWLKIIPVVIVRDPTPGVLGGIRRVGWPPPFFVGKYVFYFRCGVANEPKGVASDLNFCLRSPIRVIALFPESN